MSRKQALASVTGPDYTLLVSICYCEGRRPPRQLWVEPGLTSVQTRHLSNQTHCITGLLFTDCAGALELHACTVSYQR